MRPILLVVALAACSIPEKHLVDGAGAPFACLGQPPPSTADVKITIAGHVSDPFTGDPVSNGAVEGYLTGTPTPVFTVMTDATGAFSRDQGTGGVPVDGYLKLTANGFVDGYFYPGEPIAHDLTEDRLTLLTTTDMQAVGGIGGVQIDLNMAQVIISVIDCNGNPVPGATVSTTAGGTVRYFENARPSMTAIATDAMTGSALVANVPPTNTRVDAMVEGMMLRSHLIDARQNALTQAEIQP